MLIDTGIVCRLWLFKPSHYQHSRANLFARSGIAGSWISVGLRFKGATKLFPKAVVLLFTLLLMIIERSACPSSSPNPLHYPSFQFYSLLTDPWLFSPCWCASLKSHICQERGWPCGKVWDVRRGSWAGLLGKPLCWDGLLTPRWQHRRVSPGRVILSTTHPVSSPQIWDGVPNIL